MSKTANAKEAKPDDLNELANQMQHAIEQLQAKHETLSAQLAATRQRLLSIYRAPLDHDAVKELIFSHIDAVAAAFPQRADWAKILGAIKFPQGWRTQVLDTESIDFQGNNLVHQPGPICTADFLRIKTKLKNSNTSTLFALAGVEGNFVSGVNAATSSKDRDFLLTGLVCLLLGDRLKMAIESFIDSQGVSKHSLADPLYAMSMPARLVEMDRLEANIGEIEQEIRANDQAMADFPVAHKFRAEARFRLALPPEVILPDAAAGFFDH